MFLYNYSYLKLKWSLFFLIILFVLTVLSVQKVSAQSCPTLPTNTGRVIMSTNISSGGNYKIWNRIMLPDTTNNSFWVQIDNSCGMKITGPGTAVNNWTWIDYMNGNTNDIATLSFAAGSHTITLIGDNPQVKVDRLIITSDLACIPNNMGDNCNSLSSPIITGVIPTWYCGGSGQGICPTETPILNMPIGTVSTVPSGGTMPNDSVLIQPNESQSPINHIVPSTQPSSNNIIQLLMQFFLNLITLLLGLFTGFKFK